MRKAEDYIHRVGRTARAATTGVAITFVNPEDQYKFKKIEDTEVNAQFRFEVDGQRTRPS